jgi:hypothetical protein
MSAHTVLNMQPNGMQSFNYLPHPGNSVGVREGQNNGFLYAEEPERIEEDDEEEDDDDDSDDDSVGSSSKPVTKKKAEKAKWTHDEVRLN